MPIITSVLSALAEWPADREHPSGRTQQDPLSEQRNDGCRRLAAIGIRSIGARGSQGDHMSETKREYANNYRKPPLHTRFKKGQSGNPRGRPKKDLPALLLAALNEPVFVTIDGKRRKITKREVIVTRMVNNAAGAASLRPGRQGGDQGRRRADTGSPAARNPGYECRKPGSRDDLAASGVPRSA